MSPRAVKRQKRTHVKTSSPSNRAENLPQNNASQALDGDHDTDEEAVRPPGRRNVYRQDVSTSSRGGKLQLTYRGNGKGGLKQSALDFSKARKQSPLRSACQQPLTRHGIEIVSTELGEDLIEDDEDENIPGEATTRLPTTDSAHKVPAAGKVIETKNVKRLQKTGSQLFASQSLDRRASSCNRPVSLKVAALNNLPWTQQYCPQNLDELGVHKRKVADVRSWISNVLDGYERKRLLVLRGPPGSGKTATIKILSMTLKFNILEWHNPLTSTTAWGEYVSGTASFEDFISRGQRYGHLQLANAQSASREHQSDGIDVPDTSSRRIILMEEDPQSYTNNSTVLANFRSSIQRYLQAEESLFISNGFRSASSRQNRPPIVMIISESIGITGSGAASSSISAHRLLGQELLSNPRLTVIDFNPVAPTILTKALDLVVDKARHDGVTKLRLSSSMLHKLAESGDIRGAIGTLEFLSQRELGPTSHSTVRRKGKSKPKSAGEVLTSSESALLNVMGPRSPMLDLFHAVGKVVYNKRQPLAQSNDDETLCTSDTTLPVSEVDPDAVLDSTSHDYSTFIAALHENYILSCNGDSFVETFGACSDALSSSDILGTDPLSLRSTFFAASPGTDAASLRQGDLAAQAAIRGLLQGLPYPVSRKQHGSSRDAHKMFWPESVRVQGRTEEVKDGLRVWSNNNSARSDGMRSASMLENTFLWEIPYRAIIYHATGEPGLKLLEKIAGMNNSTWLENNTNLEADRSTHLGSWRPGSSIEQANNSAAGDMQSVVPGSGEKWVLSDDDIEE